MLIAIDFKYTGDYENSVSPVQVAIVNEDLKLIYRSYINNNNKTCLAHLSNGFGFNNIDEHSDAKDLLPVQDDIQRLLQNCTVVGSYGVHFKLKALNVKTTEMRVCDISQLPPFKNDGPITLEFFAKKYLGVQLLHKKYDPEERAICIMQLCVNYISRNSNLWK